MNGKCARKKNICAWTSSQRARFRIAFFRAVNNIFAAQKKKHFFPAIINVMRSTYGTRVLKSNPLASNLIHVCRQWPASVVDTRVDFLLFMKLWEIIVCDNFFIFKIPNWNKYFWFVLPPNCYSRRISSVHFNLDFLLIP